MTDGRTGDDDSHGVRGGQGRTGADLAELIGAGTFAAGVLLGFILCTLIWGALG